MSEWKETNLDSIALVNPIEALKKGVRAKKIAMETLQPFNKKISRYSIESYNGGMKFRNGDTLVARITPCLENGKTAYVDVLEDNEVGFGSTEYIVIRERKGASDRQFLYYFLISPEFRDVAILSMSGSSGRQRVQTDVVRNHIFSLPSLPEQRAIASILSSLDDKIDLLHRQNRTFESMAEALFQKCFVAEADEGWEAGLLGEYIRVIDNRGKTPPLSEQHTDYPVIEVNALSGDDRLINYSVIKKYVSEDIYQRWFRAGHPIIYDTLIATVGSIGEMAMFLNDKGTIAQNIVAFRAVNTSPFYLYQYLKSITQKIKGFDIGSVQPSIKVSHLINLKFKQPSKKALSDFDKTMQAICDKLVFNRSQIRTLEKMRDTLLPKLMSGEVRVKV